MTMTRRPALALSIGQMMKLIVFAAGACACIAPAAQLWHLETGARLAFVLFEAVATPLAMFLLSIVLLRRGIFRDRFQIGSLMASVAAALGAAIWYLSLLVSFLIGGGGQFRLFAPTVGTTVLVVLTLAATLISLMARLRRTLRDPRSDRGTSSGRDRPVGGDLGRGSPT